MPTTCHISFENNPQKVVHSGQLFRGTVQLNLQEEVNVRGIYIHLYGGAYTHWRECFKMCRKHTANEDYLNQRTYFVGGTNGEVQLSPGTYNYNFGCKLPIELPTSIEGKYGYIRYTALVVIDNKKPPEKTFRENFSVIRDVDLNSNLRFYLRKRIIVDSRKLYRRSILLFCWCPDTIRIIARTTVGGFACGQMINLDMLVDNHSAIPISKFTVHLVRKITYFKSAGSKDRRIEVSTINKQNACGVDRYKNKIVLVNIEVPPTPPTDTTSSLISVEHLLRIIGPTPCCRTNVRIDIPITIGTLPIRENIDAELARQKSTSFSHAHRNGASTSSLAINHEVSPLYEDEFKSGRGRSSKNKFKPKYPVFKSATFYSSRNSPQ